MELENIDSVRQHLKNYLLKHNLNELYSVYKKQKDNDSNLNILRGGIGFLVFTVAVDHLSTADENIITPDWNDNEGHSEEDLMKIIREVIEEDHSVYEFIRTEYEINFNSEGMNKNEKLELAKIEYHKEGTTSYIFKTELRDKESDGNQIAALKILKYRYIADTTITNNTKTYKVKYKDHEYTPKLYANGYKYILMEFIEGETLQGFIRSSLKGKPNSDKVISAIFKKLCDILFYFAKKGIIHSDLNTSNILLKNEHKIEVNAKTNEVIGLELYLIDFGVNYILNEKVGTSQALYRASLYIPNEVLLDYNNASIMSDIYSLGMILLEMLTISSEEGLVELENTKIDEYLDILRLNEPVLISILDEILDKNPDLRLFELQHKFKNGIKDKINNRDFFKGYYGYDDENKRKFTKKFAGIYQDLLYNISLEFKLIEIREENRNFRFVTKFLSVINTDFKSLATKLFAEANYLNRNVNNDDKNELSFRVTARRLGNWALLAQISHIVVFIGFMIVLFCYFGIGLNLKELPILKYFDLSGVRLIQNINVQIKDVFAAVVLLSFSFIAVRYYTVLFRNLYPKHLGPRGYITNIWLRFCTFFWPIPILYSFYKDGNWWLYVAAFGTCIVAINNLLTYWLAIKAKAILKIVFDLNLTKTINDRLKEYIWWWWLMFVVAVGLLCFGLFLEWNLLEDEFAYMAIVFAINIKMWLTNCSKIAYNTNRTLHFLYSRYYRALKYAELHNIEID